MLHARMVGGREQEAEAGLVEHAARGGGATSIFAPNCFEHVGRAAFRADAAIAVLGDRQPACRRDEAGGGRDVDQPRPVAAGAAAIGEQIIGPLERQRRGRQAHAPRRSFPRRSRPSSAARSACRQSRPAPACRAPAARTDAAHRRSANPRRSSNLGNGLGTGPRSTTAAARAGGGEWRGIGHGNLPSGACAGNKKTRRWAGFESGRLVVRSPAAPSRRLKEDARHHDRAAAGRGKEGRVDSCRDLPCRGRGCQAGEGARAAPSAQPSIPSISRAPSGVRIDSGWNCSPNWPSSALLTAIAMPSSTAWTGSRVGTR